MKRGNVDMAQQRTEYKSILPVVLLISVFTLVIIAGCGGQPEEISAEFGEQVELRPGQAVTIDGDDISLKFVEVTGDSRCPSGATCVWEGEVTGILEITHLGESYQKTITQLGLSGEMVTVAFGEYAIEFNFLPYPELDKEIKPGDYRLELEINKAVKLSHSPLERRAGGNPGF